MSAMLWASYLHLLIEMYQGQACRDQRIAGVSLFAQYNIFHSGHMCAHHEEVASGCRVLSGKLKSNSMSYDAPIYAILTCT